MTILKRLILCLAITPLAISIAFAIGGNDPIGGIDIIIKKPVEQQATVKQPAITKEHRVIKQHINLKANENDKDQGNIQKMIHYSETSGIHNPRDSLLFEEIAVKKESVINLKPAERFSDRISITHGKANTSERIKE